MQYEDVKKLLQSGQLQYYNIYGVQAPEAKLTSQYYRSMTHDTVDIGQKLKVTYFDIEVYIPERVKPNPKKHAICAFSLVYDNDAYLFGLIPPNKLRDDIDVENIITIVKNHVKEDCNVHVNLFTDERQLLVRAWQKVHELNPTLMSGWNIDGFDVPYTMERLQALFSAKWKRIVSQLGLVKEKFGYYQLPDFAWYDLMYFYKPRDEGGLGYGKKEPTYALDYISEQYLGIKKIQHVTDLNTMYEQETDEFFAYNIVDTILCQMLDKRFQFYSLHNTLRRLMGVPFSSSLRGPSFMFEAFINKTLDKAKVRYGWLAEVDFKTENLGVREVRSVVKSYPGAYVKNPKAGIYDTGLIMDLDASKLYPSMIMQFNISFDTLYGLIIDPTCYKLLGTIEKLLDARSDQFFEQVKNTFVKIIKDKYGRMQKGKTVITKAGQQLLEVILVMIERIYQSELTAKEVWQPTTDKGIIVLRKYILPLLEIGKRLKDAPEYNTFAYDYIFATPKNTYVYVVVNWAKPNMRIEKWEVYQLKERVQKDLILTLTGALFYKHEVKRGLFFDFLQNLAKMRKEFEKQAREAENEIEKERLLKNALTTKIVMNTTYGLYGLPSFVFSNHYLAGTITIQGRTTIKLAQWIADQTIKELAL